MNLKNTKIVSVVSKPDIKIQAYKNQGFFTHMQLYFLKYLIQGWRDDSVVKKACCSSEELSLVFRTHISQLLVILILGYLTPCSDSMSICIYMANTHTHKYLKHLIHNAQKFTKTNSSPKHKNIAQKSKTY